MESEYQIERVHTYFPLHPETPPEGLPLAELFRGHEDAVAGMRDRMRRLMAAEGLPYGDRTHTYNRRLAQELAVWGDESGATDRLHGARYRSYFAQGLNLSDPEVLVAAAAGAGLDPDEARAVVDERRFRDTVDGHWKAARELGVTGVPTFVAGGYGVVGAQPYETLVTLMERLGVPRPRNAE